MKKLPWIYATFGLPWVPASLWVLLQDGEPWTVCKVKKNRWFYWPWESRHLSLTEWKEDHASRDVRSTSFPFLFLSLLAWTLWFLCCNNFTGLHKVVFGADFKCQNKCENVSRKSWIVSRSSLSCQSFCSSPSVTKTDFSFYNNINKKSIIVQTAKLSGYTTDWFKVQIRFFFSAKRLKWLCIVL